MSFTKRRSIKWHKYRIVEKELQHEIENLRQKHGDSVRIFEDAKEGNTFDKGNREKGIRVIAKDPLTLDACCNALDQIMYGDSFSLKTLSQIRKMNLESTKDRLTQIENKLNVYMEFDKRRKQLKVFGESESRKKTIKELEILFSQPPVKNIVQEKISFRFRPIRHLLKDNAAELSDLEQKFGVNITYSLRNKEIIISGQNNKVTDAAKEVRRLIDLYAQKKEINENDCPICLDNITEGYRLQLCGHKFCHSCIAMELSETLQNNPEFPLVCSHCKIEGDDNGICVRDLQNILTYDELQTLWERSLAKYIGQNSKLFFQCYTPSCSQIFKHNSEKIFECDYCLKIYCKKCKSDAHGDGDCDDEARKKLLDDLRKSGKDIKECPKCSYVIEKNEGCHKMHCIKCHTIFCWLCLEIFPSEGKTYKHLEEVHKRIGDLDPYNLPDDF